MRIDQLKEQLGNKFKKMQQDVPASRPSLKDYQQKEDGEMRPYSTVVTALPTTEKIRDTKETRTEEKDQKPRIKETQKRHKRDIAKTQQEHNRNTKGTQERHIRETTRTQKGHDNDTKETQQEHNIKTTNQPLALSGNALKLASFVYNLCLLNKGLETDYICKKEISSQSKVHISSLKTTAYRMIDKGVFTDIVATKGRHSMWKFSLAQSIFEAFEKSGSNTSEKSIRDTNEFTYSSSNNINITTKTTNLPENWGHINFAPLQDIGFSTTQLKQLIGKNEADIVQESINHFAYGLEHNPKLKKYSDPLNVFMGVLRKGQAWVEPNYQSPKEIALEKLLASKKAEKERLKKLEDNAFEMAFSEWTEGLSDEQKNEIAPPKKPGSLDVTPPKVKLSSYFRENIWPEKKGEYLV